MNTFKTLYNAIETAIKTNVTEVAWLDWDLGQLDLEAPPVSWPFVLVDIPNMPFSNMGELRQIAQPTIQLTIGFKRLERSHFKRDEAIADVAFAHLAVIQKIYNALHGLSAENFSPLVGGTFNKRTKSTHYEFVLTFSCATLEREAQRKYTFSAKPPGEITAQ